MRQCTTAHLRLALLLPPSSPVPSFYPLLGRVCRYRYFLLMLLLFPLASSSPPPLLLPLPLPSSPPPPSFQATSSSFEPHVPPELLPLSFTGSSLLRPSQELLQLRSKARSEQSGPLNPVCPRLSLSSPLLSLLFPFFQESDSAMRFGYLETSCGQKSPFHFTPPFLFRFSVCLSPSFSTSIHLLLLVFFFFSFKRFRVGTR